MSNITFRLNNEQEKELENMAKYFNIRKSDILKDGLEFALKKLKKEKVENELGELKNDKKFMQDMEEVANSHSNLSD